jgi:hypothetical protein
MRAIRCMCFLILVLSLVPHAAWSQGTTSLSGNVTDATGAVIPGAEVTLINSATNATRTATTNEVGAYLFAQLPPGTYKVEFKREGFSTVVRDNVALPIGTPQVLSVSLTVGEMTQNVTIEGGAIPVNTVDAAQGSPFTELQVKQLPLEARNPSQLLSLQAGVIWAGENLSDQRQGSVFGSRPNQGNITLDGADVNDQVAQTAMQSVLPIPLDSVQEFRVTTTTGGAQYGRSSGAQIELVTKSGGNTFHGSAYEFNRNEALASNGFFENRLGIKKAPLKRNIFGASAGGPIKQNRVFFFANWESRRDRTATPQTRVVPSDSLRDGVLLYQCATPAECPGGTVQGLTSTHSVRSGWFGVTPNQVRDVIDPCGSTSCIDALGKAVNPGVNSALINLLKGYPHGNDPTLGSILGIDNGFNSVGYRFAAPITVDNNDYVARLDFNLDPNGKHIVYLRGSLADDKQINVPAQFLTDPLTGEATTATSILLNNSKGMAASYTALIRPNVINTVRYGFTRQGLNAGGTEGPAFTLRGLDSFRNFGGGGRASNRIVPTHSLQDDLTWNKGRNTIQYGFTFRNITNNRSSMAPSFQSFGANNNWQDGLGRNCILPGNSPTTCPNASRINALPRIVAAFNPYVRATIDLLGLYSNASGTVQFDAQGNPVAFGTAQIRRYVTNEYEAYVQDSIRLSSNLNVTLGLRYSFGTVPYEKNGLQVRPSVDLGQWFSDRIANMQNGIPSDRSPLISYTLGGKANNAAGWFDADKNNFAPRISLAYSPGFDNGIGRILFGAPGQSSIRGGFSMFYDRLSGGLMGQLAAAGETGLATPVTTPFALMDTLGNPLIGTKTAIRFTGYDNLPPITAFATLPKGGFPAVPLADSNQINAGIVGNLKTPYSYQFSLSVQREVASNTIVDVGYVGRFGRSLLVQGDYSQWLNLKDTKSGATLYQAFSQLENYIHSVTNKYDGVCLKTPAACPQVPYIENVFSGMNAYWSKVSGKTFNSNTAAMADYASTFAPNWGDMMKALDANIPVNSGTSVYDPSVDPQADGRVLFPQQYTEFPVWSNGAESFYNGLLVSVRKRAGAIQFDANYVLSKSIDDGSGLEGEDSFYNGVLPNNFEARAQRGLSDFDLRHNFNANWLVELPVGRGKAIAPDMPGWADQIVGGWQITGVQRWRSGFPIGVYNGAWFPTVWNIDGYGTQVSPIETNIQKSAANGPNLFASPVDTSSGNGFDATSTAFGSFTHTPMGGSGSRNVLRAGRFFTIDAGIGKSFRITEGQRLQFRWEIFNVTNTVSFASSRAAGRAGSNNNISLSLDSPSSFGRIINATSSASQSYPLVPHNRVMQLGLRYEF